jgi:hypothetical protein
MIVNIIRPMKVVLHTAVLKLTKMCNKNKKYSGMRLEK